MSVLDHSATGAIATLTLTRPESMNALGQAGDGEAFAAACDAINADSTIRCAILTGAGRAFMGCGWTFSVQIMFQICSANITLGAKVLCYST